MLAESVFEGFERFDWTACPGCLSDCSGGYVYVFVLSLNGSRLPFYVGETSDLTKRVGDYEYASFHAPTDFKVGEAIKYLVGKQCNIEILARQSATGKKDERALIRELQVSGVNLLNDLVGFNYWESKAEDERKFIERFCDMLMRKSSGVN